MVIEIAKMNPYHQAFEFGQLRDPELVGEMYNPEPTSFSQVQPIYQAYDSNAVYVNAKSKTPGRGRTLVDHQMTVPQSENPVPPVVSAFISTVVNTVPHVSIVNGRVPHMPYEMIASPAVSYVSHPTFIPEPQMFLPYTPNVYPEAYHHPVPYVSPNIMSNVTPAVPYVNSPTHHANHLINRSNEYYFQSRCGTPPAKGGPEEMLPVVKDIIESFSKVKVTTSSKKAGTVPRIVNSTVDESTSRKNEYGAKVDIMTYVNNDNLYEKFMAKTDDDTEKKPYAKKMAESDRAKVEAPKRNKKNKKSTAKRQPQPRPRSSTFSEKKTDRRQDGKPTADSYLPYVVESAVNSVIGDLMDSDNEKIISGNVCPKIRSLAIVQPEVRVEAENVAGMLSSTENWPELMPSGKSAPHRRASPGPVQHRKSNEQSRKRARPEYLERPRPFRLEAPATSRLCDFYRSTSIGSLKRHLSSRWRANQSCDCCGETPLHFAVRRNSVQLLDMASGARLELGNKKGETALHVACETNNEVMATRLLDRRANPCRRNSKEETCLLVCMRKGHVKLAELILAKGKADLSGEDPKKHLLTASRRGSKDFVQLFLNFRAKVDHTDEHGNTAISLAVTSGHREVIDCLIKCGANLSRTYTKDRDSLLHLACRHNQEASLQRLLCAGISVHAENGNLERPIHLAAKFSSTKMAHMLLSSGADIEAEDSWMRTPLYLAILSGRVCMAKYLLSRGASTKTVVAPLIRELKNNSFHMIKLLVSYGLNVNQSDQLGQSLVDAVVKYGDADLLNCLLKNEETSHQL